ncbi:class I fructose-bisphosphate aldolase [Vallitalea sediminicola]
MLDTKKIYDLLGEDSQILDFKNPKIKKEQIAIPNCNTIDDIFAQSDRNNRVLVNLNRLYSTGRLGESGYISILPVDQGVEHSAGASFAKNPLYFDPENIVKLAIEAGCNGVVSTLGGLSIVSRKYAHKIPLVVKVNHNELLSYPNTFDQIKFASVDQAYNMGAAGIGATIYFGSKESNRQIIETSEMFEYAHSKGLFTILWCYLRNDAFNKDKNYHASADLTGQANHLGVTIGADIIKQKLPMNNGGFKALNMGESDYGKFDERIYTELSSENPIDLTRYQILNNYMGRIPLINSGGPSGENDLAEAVKTAVINKRAGGSGLILGRKAFQKPFKEGVEIINAIQDVYLNKDITIA